MSEKIDGLPAPLPQMGTRNVAEKEPLATGTVQAGAGDSVSLTQTGKLLAGAAEMLAEVPEIDRERVAALKQAMADGSYTVDATRVAENILRFEEMLKSEE